MEHAGRGKGDNLATLPPVWGIHVKVSEETGLKRGIGLFSATAIGVGAIIGAGIFVVTGIAAGLAGPGVIVSMIVAGVISAFTALSFSELGVYLPKEGGSYVFAHELISPLVGFVAGWMWIFSNIFAGAAVSLGFAHYFVSLFLPLPVKAVAAVICLSFTLLNYLGVRQSAILNNILVLAKILILLCFIVFGAAYLKISYFTPFAPNGFSGILHGSALIFFAYAGFARITTMAEEVREPSRTIPRSIILSLAISSVIYLFASFIAVGLVGYVDLSRTGSPLAEAAHATGSAVAVFVVSVGAMLATASVLLTTILGVSRVAFAMARNDDLPRSLSRIHSKYGTPYYSVWITGSLMVVTAVFADLTQVVAASIFASLFYYLIANMAALRLRGGARRYPVFVPAVGSLSCLGLLAFLTADSWIVGAIGLVLGIVYYQVYKRFRRSGVL